MLAAVPDLMQKGTEVVELACCGARKHGDVILSLIALHVSCIDSTIVGRSPRLS